MTDDELEIFNEAVPLEGERWDPNRLPDEAVSFVDALTAMSALTERFVDPNPGGPLGWATGMTFEYAADALRSDDCGWYWLEDDTISWMVPAAAALPDDVTLDVDSLPEPCGYLTLEHEVLTPGGDGAPCPMRGLVWFTTRTAHGEAAVVVVFFSNFGGGGNATPAGWSTWVHGDGLTARCGPADPASQEWDRRFLSVLWYLAGPDRAGGGRVTPARHGRRRAQRAGIPGPRDGVRVIHLGELDNDDSAGDGGPSSESREYRHRWWVRGHWRSQPYGPSRSLRRPVWIQRQLRGPEGAPVLPTRNTVKVPHKPREEQQPR